MMRLPCHNQASAPANPGSRHTGLLQPPQFAELHVYGMSRVHIVQPGCLQANKHTQLWLCVSIGTTERIRAGKDLLTELRRALRWNGRVALSCSCAATSVSHLVAITDACSEMNLAEHGSSSMWCLQCQEHTALQRRPAAAQALPKPLTTHWCFRCTVLYRPAAFSPNTTTPARRARYDSPSAPPRSPEGPAGRPLPVCTLVYADQPTRPSTTCTRATVAKRLKLRSVAYRARAQTMNVACSWALLVDGSWHDRLIDAFSTPLRTVYRQRWCEMCAECAFGTHQVADALRSTHKSTWTWRKSRSGGLQHEL